MNGNRKSPIQCGAQIGGVQEHATRQRFGAGVILATCHSRRIRPGQVGTSRVARSISAAVGILFPGTMFLRGSGLSWSAFVGWRPASMGSCSRGSVFAGFRLARILSNSPSSAHFSRRSRCCFSGDHGGSPPSVFAAPLNFSALFGILSGEWPRLYTSVGCIGIAFAGAWVLRRENALRRVRRHSRTL